MEYNVQKEARVWSRVMGGECGCSCGQGLGADTVMELYRQEREAACLFSALACRLPRHGQQRLGCLISGSRSRMRQLGAVYFVLTGQKACCEHAAPCVTCAAESLRQAYEALLGRKKQYGAWGKEERFSHSFRCLSRSADADAETLLCLMGCIV